MRRTRPAPQRFDAGQQFGERERFRNVVVAPLTQAAHPLVDAGARTGDQDRRLLAQFARLADDRQTIDLARRQAIKDHDVPGLVGRVTQPVQAVVA